MRRFSFCALVIACFFKTAAAQQPVHVDRPFEQEHAVKYRVGQADKKLIAAAADRNGKIQLVGASGLLQPNNGQFLFPGDLVRDNVYRFMKDKTIRSIARYEDQLVYLTDKLVFSNAWAGEVYLEHGLKNASVFAGGKDFQFLVADSKSLHLVKDGKITWKGALKADEVVDVRYQKNANAFWILGKSSLSVFSPATQNLNQVFKGNGFTAFDINSHKNHVLIGTKDGCITFNISTGEQEGAINKRLPVNDITSVCQIGEKTWFGSSNGAFALRPDGKFDYYQGERWVLDNQISGVFPGPGKNVLLLTQKGLTELVFQDWTLRDKAAFFDKQVRSRHIRNGFNSTLDGLQNGNVNTGFLADSDNDGLWTSMYLGGEAFRFVVTQDAEALKNCRESLDAMERLYAITPVPGFPARSYERAGHTKELADPERWQHSAHPDWDWKSTTSSDEVIGHIFVFGVMAELIDDEDIRSRSITLIDTLMSHILRNNMYLIDYDGKPTQWGRWHPEYVNSFPVSVGDRKLNSSNIVAMLQTAYHFTKKEKYKAKAFELMDKHGYFENLMRPIENIGKTDGAGDLSSLLSDRWNHSDDEMYFLGYWGLYRYAFNDTLKTHFKDAIVDHWQAERPEKEGLWNIFTAITGVRDFDLKEAIWYLQEHPTDLINWSIQNSHRKDIDLIAPNFRNQSTKEVLPPDERRAQRHNGNMFTADMTHGNGDSELSAGDIWLLPYWLGRYLGVISAPEK
ncbi:hypothetical protein GCM10023091_35740 [Ravibacter arvi]|uniref:Uncharacterized protein n=1 Tax=Ravibacter arvi TaxID=2051041 RepID=A0ABP8M7Z4_9BACT